MADEAELQQWIDQLASFSWEKRVKACAQLADLGDPRAVRHIVPLINHWSASVRTAGIDAVRRLGEGDLIQLWEDVHAGKPDVVSRCTLLREQGDFRIIDYLMTGRGMMPREQYRCCRAFAAIYGPRWLRGRQWLCRNCLTRFHLWTYMPDRTDQGPNIAAYYGLLSGLTEGLNALLCRTCQMARYGVPGVERVVAVLAGDQPQTPAEEIVPHVGVVEIHWHPGRPLFDFDVVDVHAAPDQHVEAFCMMAGNDPDKRRHHGYRKLPCHVDSTCGLSAATLNMLDATFGKVTVEPPAKLQIPSSG